MAGLTGSMAARPSMNRGFTLIELMIVVVILSVLVGIAYPSYTQYVIKSKRADAKSMLSQVASRQEQFFLNNKSYTTGLAAVWDAGGISEEGFYALTVASGTTGSVATSYALTAVPRLDQLRDVECQSFTLNSRGERGIVDGPPTGSPTGTAAGCW